MRAPAEWEEQAGVWLCWPTCHEHWGERIEGIQNFVLKLTAEILVFQPVFMLVNEGVDQAQIMNHFSGSQYPLTCVALAHDDLWIRDYGPFFIESDQKLIVQQFKFNSWGGKFPPWDLDISVARRLAEYLGLDFSCSELTLEGGAFDFNGSGIGMTTRPCIVAPTRNPNWVEADIVNEICHHLGLVDLIVFPSGLMGDHTDGHVDNLVRFVSEREVILPQAVTGDVNEERLTRVKEQLQAWAHPTEEWKFKITEFPPMPPIPFGNGWLPRSYMNFIFVNGGILFPDYGHESLGRAKELFAKVFPDRKIVAIDCRLLIEEGGALHCMTRQFPKVRKV